jgi:PAS domain S-box-containing protein
MAVVATVDSPPPPADDLATRLEFETLLAEVSSRFINLRPDEIDREIEQALRAFCELLGIDLALLWRRSDGVPDVYAPTHVYCVPGVVLPSEPMHQEDYPWCKQQMFAGRVFSVTSLDDLPAEADVDRESLRRFGVRSALGVPIFVGGEAVGCLGLNALRVARVWPDALVHRLELVGQVFANALARRRNELKLRESEEISRATFEQAAVGIAHVGTDGRWLRVNDKLCAIVGYPKEELLNLTFQDITHPDDLETDLDYVRQVLSGEIRTYSMEKRYIRRDRSVVWVDLTVSLLRTAAGEPKHFISVVEDVTERRRAEEALRDSYAEVQRLKDRLQAESDYLKAEIGVGKAQGDITGQSAATRKVMRLIEQVAPTDSSVLLHGETGTGKELVAVAIHRHSSRRNHLMVKVNCAALPSGLMESELFGREKGAFTGALTRQIGRFEVADGSTLFLDEIGELSLDLQAKLLRVLEAGEFERLGSPRTIKVNVRMIAATNRDLTEAIRQGRFREDLYYRLNVFPIRMPPLRERPEDIPLLVWEFLDAFNTRMGKKITRVPRKTMEALQVHHWTGNVRELRNVIEHGVIVSTGDTLQVPMLDDAAPSTAALPQTLAEAEREIIIRALDRTGWHLKGPHGAAAALGLNPSTLRSRMKKLGIQPRLQPGNGPS